MERQDKTRLENAIEISQAQLQNENLGASVRNITTLNYEKDVAPVFEQFINKAWPTELANILDEFSQKLEEKEGMPFKRFVSRYCSVYPISLNTPIIIMPIGDFELDKTLLTYQVSYHKKESKIASGIELYIQQLDDKTTRVSWHLKMGDSTIAGKTYDDESYKTEGELNLTATILADYLTGKKPERVDYKHDYDPMSDWGPGGN